MFSFFSSVGPIVPYSLNLKVSYKEDPSLEHLLYNWTHGSTQKKRKRGFSLVNTKRKTNTISTQKNQSKNPLTDKQNTHLWDMINEYIGGLVSSSHNA
jgi:hypothetical protein